MGEGSHVVEGKTVAEGRTVFGGTLVVELASGIAGPYATGMFADHGATVVKVEFGDGDPLRTEPGFQALNRNKRSIRLGEGLVGALEAGALDELLSRADLVVVDTPGLLDTLRNLAPDAVLVSMTPWGEAGPMVDQPATPARVASMTGLSWNQLSYSDGPVHLVLPLAAYGAGMLGALAAAAGLYQRATTGVAGTFEASQVSGAGAMQLGDFWVEPMPLERDPSCALGSKGRVPVYRLFEGSDGNWLFVACGTTAFYERMMETIGRGDLLGDPRLPAPPWGLLELEPLAFITPILDEVFATRTRDEWLAALRAADVPCQPVQTREEFLASDLARSNDLPIAVEHPTLGRVEMTAPPIELSATPAAVERPAPGLGDHNLAELLAEFPKDRPRPHCSPESSNAASTSASSGEGAKPLAGVQAIDLSSFIAGPVISRHLAMLGADVIKVESPTGDAFRAMGPMFNGWNQGKRSIVLDLRSDEGQADAHRLAASSDVVIENFRPGVAERLGMGLDELRSANGDVVIVKSPGYGRDEELAPQAAFDPLLQALGGVMASQGGDGEPVFLSSPVHDVATPMLSAFGVVAALLHRHFTGETQTVRTSLAQTTTAVQVMEMVRYPGSPAPETGGFDHKGSSDERTFELDDEGTWTWLEGGVRTPVERNGFVMSAIAIENGLVVHQEHPELGVLQQTGQLVGGAGPHPMRSPLLDEHGPEIRREFGLT